jgi:hypothetical protein
MMEMGEWRPPYGFGTRISYIVFRKHVVRIRDREPLVE